MTDGMVTASTILGNVRRRESWGEQRKMMSSVFGTCWVSVSKGHPLADVQPRDSRLELMGQVRLGKRGLQ